MAVTYSNLSISDINVSPYIELILATDASGDQLKYVEMYIGDAYQIGYFDSNTNSLKLETCIITGISDYDTDSSAYILVDIISADEDSIDRVTSKDAVISIGNIHSINEVLIIDNDYNPNRHSRKGGFIVVLSMTAEVIQAVIIRLGILKDGSDDSTTYLNLAAGNTYDTSYESYAGSGTILEISGKLTSIVEEERPALTYLGIDFAQYVNSDKRYKLIFDTSTESASSAVEVSLDLIRDITLVGDDVTNTSITVETDSFTAVYDADEESYSITPTGSEEAITVSLEDLLTSYYNSTQT